LSDISSSLLLSFFFYRYAPPRSLHSFPTRRSSDLFSQPVASGQLLQAEPAEVQLLDQARRSRSTPMYGAGFRLDVSAGSACKSRSEEHTSELQSRSELVCRLLLEKKKKKQKTHNQI